LLQYGHGLRKVEQRVAQKRRAGEVGEVGFGVGAEQGYPADPKSLNGWNSKSSSPSQRLGDNATRTRGFGIWTPSG